jgi:hypothetical protein
VARIRKIEIENFRCIKALKWQPSDGINCLIGPGDSGKSTILDAIDLCLGARRTVQFTDADFFNLDVGSPIKIELTIGELNDSLKDFETYGLYLRGLNLTTGELEDEPEKGLETVLTLCLTVGSDLEPAWTLVSDRARAQKATRNLAWIDRIALAPTRIGAFAESHLGWRRGSVLNRLTDEKPDTSAALAKAARDARAAFGADAEKQLGETLRVVGDTAKELGIDVGDKVRALLDAHSVTFAGGTISLHSEEGVPLRGLGTGSSRLLIAGLQKKAADRSRILLVDELEHGLEPHRIIRFLGSLGAKASPAPLQAFITTHSPVTLRELNGDQLFILRDTAEGHSIRKVGSEDDAQSTLRLYPDAFLAPSVIVCEGASEVGLLRGIDQHRATLSKISIAARGTALVDCGGGEADKPYKRASAFRRLGYRTAILRDNDLHPSPEVEKAYSALGGIAFSWRNGRTLEDELFLSLTPGAVKKLLDFAAELHGDELINEHIKTASANAKELSSIFSEIQANKLADDSRSILGRAARSKKAGWFKSVSWMEEAARKIVAQDLAAAEAGFRALVDQIFAWADDVG